MCNHKHTVVAQAAKNDWTINWLANEKPFVPTTVLALLPRLKVSCEHL